MVENNSMYIGNVPSSSTNNAQDNLAFGPDALDAITSGNLNIAIGRDALKANTTGGSNIAIGKNALKASVDRVQNIAIGYNVLSTVSTASASYEGRYNIGAVSYTHLTLPTKRIV